MPKNAATLGAIAVAMALGACSPQSNTNVPDTLIEQSLTDSAAQLDSGKSTADALTAAYLKRIAAVDPQLKSVLLVNEAARDQAKASDARRAQKQAKGPLDGMPILIKDNIDVAGMPNTAGSLALADNMPAKDAPMVKRLIDAGVVVLGKTNLSEWANIRSAKSSSGWSGVGGLTRNPYALDRTACGSSSGTGAAIAASLAAGGIGTETDGSVTCPASMNGLVGLKPTVGLVSRSGIIPISHSQDTAGPMTRTVQDAAAMLTVMAGSDPGDPATADADSHRTDYLKGLDANALKGARIGVARFMAKDFLPTTRAVFDEALAALKAQGAELVDIEGFDMKPINDSELMVMLTELKVDLKAYLDTTDPAKVKPRTLADLIAFNKQEAAREMPWFGQDLFEQAETTKGYDDPGYRLAHDTIRDAAGPSGIDRLLRENNVIALVTPTTDPAWVIDLVNGDHNSPSATTLAAVAGYPHLTVPMGAVAGLPVGLSFIGPAWSEQLLLSLGYAYEQTTHARKAPTYPASLHSSP